METTGIVISKELKLKSVSHRVHREHREDQKPIHHRVHGVTQGKTRHFLCETLWSGLQLAALWLVAFGPFLRSLCENTKLSISREIKILFLPYPGQRPNTVSVIFFFVSAASVVAKGFGGTSCVKAPLKFCRHKA
jgi:hypothetical protein